MAGVDGVAAVAYGTPESAAAILAASESASGVRGGLGGGGAGAASLTVGEQLQNMVPGSAGSDLKRDGAENCGAKLFPDVRLLQGQWCGLMGEETRVALKNPEMASVFTGR